MGEVRKPTVAVMADHRGVVYRELLNGQIVRSSPKKKSRARERREKREREKE